MKYLILLSFTLTSCTPDACNNVYSKIKYIDGCNIEGYCGVILENGTYLVDVYHPVVGHYPQGDHCLKIPR